MPCESWPRPGTGKTAGISRPWAWRSRSARATFCRRSSTALCTASSTSSKTGNDGNVALPPYFPVDRNEAFIAVGNAGACRSRRSASTSGWPGGFIGARCLPLLERILPDLRAVELQQAADDILERMSDPRDGRAGGEDGDARRATRLISERCSALLARRLGGDWNAARDRPQVVQVIERTLADPETRRQGIALAAATRDGRYREQLKNLAEDVEGTRGDPDCGGRGARLVSEIVADQTLERLIASVRGKPSSNPVAEAAVRTIARMQERWKAADRASDRGRLPAGLAPRGAAEPGPASGRRPADPRAGQCRQASRGPEERGDHAGAHRFRPADSRPGGQDSAAAQDGRRAAVCRRSAS